MKDTTKTAIKGQLIDLPNGAKMDLGTVENILPIFDKTGYIEIINIKYNDNDTAEFDDNETADLILNSYLAFLENKHKNEKEEKEEKEQEAKEETDIPENQKLIDIKLDLTIEEFKEISDEQNKLISENDIIDSALKAYQKRQKSIIEENEARIKELNIKYRNGFVWRSKPCREEKNNELGVIRYYDIHTEELIKEEELSGQLDIEFSEKEE